MLLPRCEEEAVLLPFCVIPELMNVCIYLFVSECTYRLKFAEEEATFSFAIVNEKTE